MRCLQTVLVAWLMMLAACGTSVKMSARSQSVSFMSADELKRMITSTPPQCAVLPAISPSQEGLTPLSNMALAAALVNLKIESTFVAAGGSVTRINSASLAQDWNRMAGDYIISGVMDRDRLSKLGRALEARYVMVPMLAGSQSNFNPRINFLGFTVDRTFWTTVDVSLQIWDTTDGSLSWQSVGDCTVATEVLMATRASLGQAVRLAWTQMIEDLLYGRSRSVITVEVPDSAGDPAVVTAPSAVIPARDAADVQEAAPAAVSVPK